jgi:hypothetical protein
MSAPPSGPPDASTPEADGPAPAYFGIGCVTAIAGFVGGGMVAVLVAKIVGALSRCAADAETGAPCNWGTYWLRGALVGLVLLPSISIWLLRRGRRREQYTKRG